MPRIALHKAPITADESVGSGVVELPSPPFVIAGGFVEGAAVALNIVVGDAIATSSVGDPVINADGRSEGASDGAVVPVGPWMGRGVGTRAALAVGWTDGPGVSGSSVGLGVGGRVGGGVGLAVGSPSVGFEVGFRVGGRVGLGVGGRVGGGVGLAVGSPTEGMPSSMSYSDWHGSFPRSLESFRSFTRTKGGAF